MELTLEEEKALNLIQSPNFIFIFSICFVVLLAVIFIWPKSNTKF